MEGYVQVKISYTFQRLYAVVNDDILTLYETFDMEEQCPRNFKQFYHLRSAVLIKFKDEQQNILNGIKLKIKFSPSQHLTSAKQSRRFSFTTSQTQAQAASDATVLEDLSNNKTIAKLIFNFANTSECDVWYQVLHRCISWYHELQQQELTYLSHLKLLELQEYALTVTSHQITKAYKKLCLKLHPDKGGNPDQFNDIRVAYTSLIARQSFLEEQRHTKAITYEVIVEKVQGLGLGITVIEDKTRRALLVQGVSPHIKMHGITEESGGHILTGDTLVGINADDCSKWWMSRIRVRLDNNRVPVNTKVTLTFERRIPKEENEMKDGEGSVYDSPLRAMSPVPMTPAMKKASEAVQAPAADDKKADKDANNEAPIVMLPSERRASTINHVDMGTEQSTATATNMLPASAGRRASEVHQTDLGKSSANADIANSNLLPAPKGRRASEIHQTDLGISSASNEFANSNLLPAPTASSQRRASAINHVDIGSEVDNQAMSEQGLLTGGSAAAPQRRASALAHVDLGGSTSNSAADVYYLQNTDDNASIPPPPPISEPISVRRTSAVGGNVDLKSMLQGHYRTVEGNEENPDYEEIEIDPEYLQQQEERIDTLEEEKMNLLQRLEELDDHNAQLNHSVEELKGEVFQREENIITLNQSLVEAKKQLTELTHENASLKQVLDGQYQDASVKEFRDYIVILQERLLDYDMQHRDLVYQLQQAQSNTQHVGNMTDEMYQFNEERVLKMEQSMQRMIGRKLTHAHHQSSKQ